MPDPLSHSPDMLQPIRTPDLPRLWWLFPWAYVKGLQRQCRYMEMIADLDSRIIRRQEQRIEYLLEGLDKLTETLRQNTPKK